MNRDFQRIARLMSAYGNFALTVGAVQNSVLESVLKHGLQGKTEQHIIQQMLRDIYPDGKLLFYPEVHNFQIGIRVNQLIGQRVFVCRFAERISVEHSKAAGAAVVQAIRQGTSDTRSVDTETVRSYLAQQGAIVP